MNLGKFKLLYDRLNLVLDEFNPRSWSEIAQILKQIKVIDDFADTEIVQVQ